MLADGDGAHSHDLCVCKTVPEKQKFISGNFSSFPVISTVVSPTREDYNDVKP